MYFKTTYLAQDLGIRVEDNGQLKDYEHSTLIFHLSGPHDLSVEMQNVEGKYHLHCEVNSHFDPKSKVRNALEAVHRGRVPDSGASIEEAGQRIKQKKAGEHIRSYSLPWDVLPNYLKDFSKRVEQEHRDAAKRVIDVIRWREAITGPLHTLSYSGSEWSYDKKEWHPVPEEPPGARVSQTYYTIHAFNSTQVNIETLLARETTEPVGHQLYREAWEQRAENLRSALVIGIAALEVQLKEFIASLVPKAEWLVTNVPAPPLVKMLQEYLPQLDFPSPPQELLNILKKGVNLRNKVAHSGGTPLKQETVEEVLIAVWDTLWILDYYGGTKWAYERISDKTKAAMEL